MKWNNRIEGEYRAACEKKTDINEHLPVLRNLANQVKHVTELGVRNGNSTRAFLTENITLRSYDMVKSDIVDELFRFAIEAGKDAKYTIADVLTIEIEPTDLLFIDTLHTNQQLRLELELHANNAKRYLVFHDTHTFGVLDERMDWANNPNRMPQAGQGLLPAIIDFCIDNAEWKFKELKTNNNGLIILERG